MRHHVEKHGRHTANRAQKHICMAAPQLKRCPYNGLAYLFNAELELSTRLE